VSVSASVSGGAGALDARQASLAPAEAREIGWDVQVPHGTGSLTWEVIARATDNSVLDRVRVTQKVIPAVPIRTIQATIAQLSRPLSTDVEIPADAVPGKGGVNVSFRARLSEGTGAIRYFMAQYPYVCLEQKISQAVALRDETLWKSVMADLPSYLDGDGLAKYFPSSRILGSDILTSYILAVSNEAGWAVPAVSRDRMTRALVLFIEGKIVRGSGLPTADLSIRKLAALEALSRYGLARAALLDSITLETNLWPTSAVIDWLDVLLRVKEIPAREEKIRNAEQILRSRLNFQGTTMGFSTERTDYLWWLMVSGDVNAVRGIISFLKLPGWTGDIPRIVNGAIARQQRGAWNTTVANAWGVLALEKFSAKFESEGVTGRSAASLSGPAKSLDWAAAPGGGGVSFGWPKGRGSLAVSHEGSGKPWVTFQSLAAIPLKEPLSTGYKIRKTLAAVKQTEKGGWSRGDVVRVTLEIEAQADMTWVVVNDPIPGGASILGTGLSRDSSLLIEGEKREGLAWPAFTERAFEAFRAYYAFVPKGKWTVEYTVRLSNSGHFLLPRRGWRPSTPRRCSENTRTARWRSSRDGKRLPRATMKKAAFILLVGAGQAVALAALLFVRDPIRPPPGFRQVRDSFRVSDGRLLDRNGDVLHELRVDDGIRSLDWVPLSAVSSAIVNAVIRSEDRRFARHRGVDWIALGSAGWEALFRGGRRGASTITMQLASMLDEPSRRGAATRTFRRKSVQIRQALALERCWSKAEILESYLNLVTFRGELRGIHAASRGLFGKDPGGLSDPESLVLASLIRSPNASPSRVAERARRLSSDLGGNVPRGAFDEFVRETLLRPYSIAPRAALAPHVARQLLSKGGDNVVSTLDGNLQRFAAESLSRQLLSLKDRHVGDGAVLVTANRTGEILAYVGNAGIHSSAPYVDGATASRQAGSTLKPFLYGLALERRLLTAASLLDDSPLDVPTGTGSYSPRNYDREYRGLATLRTALAASLNVPAVRTLLLLPRDSFADRLRLMGFVGVGTGDDRRLAGPGKRRP
jgi:hypothetical protein